ncbi:MAG: DUF502 domain-containing protein [Bacillota bacterium]
MKKVFITGLFVLIPITATISIMFWLFNSIDSIFREPLESWFDLPLVGVGFILTVLLIFTAGIVASNYLGKKLIEITESTIKKIPIFNTVYVSIKQVMDTIFSDQKKAFKSVVFVRYPSKDIYAIGFITADAPNEMEVKIGRRMKSIFIPTTPNPTSGMLVMIPEEDIIHADLSVEAAVKLIVSGGIIN